MAAISTKPPSGMRDYLADSVNRRRHVVGVVQDVYEAYGFTPLETPAIENLTTLLGKYGDEGDQLLYRVLHRQAALARALDKEEVTEADLSDLGLRYDLTVPLARVVANYALPKFYKRYQIQPVWRADRPGKGRFREFYQCDVDITGTESLVAEAEVCSAVCEVLEKLGFEGFRLELNHRELLRAMITHAGIASEHESTALVAVDKLDKIGREGVEKELAERGIGNDSASALLDSITQTGSNAELLAQLGETLGDRGQEPLAQLNELLAVMSETPAAAHVRVSPALARGLSYYTGAIFEITVPNVAGSLGGGGRYDGLVGMFGKKNIPAVGFSLGLERILLLMEEKALYPDLAEGADIMVCTLDVPPQTALAAASVLRKQGLRVDVYPQKAKLGKQLQYASETAKATVAGILGADEAAAREITLKHLESGEQKKVPWGDAARAVRSF